MTYRLNVSWYTSEASYKYTHTLWKCLFIAFASCKLYTKNFTHRLWFPVGLHRSFATKIYTHLNLKAERQRPFGCCNKNKMYIILILAAKTKSFPLNNEYGTLYPHGNHAGGFLHNIKKGNETVFNMVNPYV